MITRSPGFPFFGRRRTVHRLAWLLLAVLIPTLEACDSAPTSYQAIPGPHQVLPLDPLTPEEMQSAERVALSDPRVKGLLSAQHKLIYVEFIAMKPDDEAKTREAWPRPIQMARYAEAVFYRESDDFGVRVIVNLERQEVTHVQRIDREQVPVPPKEISGGSRRK